MTVKIKSVRGMNDLLPGDIELWQQVEQAIRQIATLYGYSEIRLPLLERTELFKRSIGEATDIVEKEMYTFLDNNGESMTLRPEATASCVRAGVQHGFFYNAKARLWYMGPMFRYERPQKGRYRQFHQFGIEAFGWTGPDIDAEIILVSNALWKLLKIDQDAKLEINSLGTPQSREQYRSELVAYFEKYKDSLDDDSQRRLNTNPLRILDSKNPQMQDLIQSAPVLTDYLSSESKQHFAELCSRLHDLEIGYTVNHRLVRGLDYYTGTVFEWVTDRLGAQNAICAGGRYDGLVEALGGKEVPGAGFAMGIERLVEIVKQGSMELNDPTTQAYVCSLGDSAQRLGFSVAETLRASGISTTVHCGSGNLARQLRSADRLDAWVGIIIGETEVSSDTVTIKNLQSDEPQKVVSVASVVEVVKQMLTTES